MPTTYAAFDVPPHRVPHTLAATSATRSKQTPLTVSAAAAKITGRNESRSNSLPRRRAVRVENLRNQAVRRTLESGPACTLRAVPRCGPGSLSHWAERFIVVCMYVSACSLAVEYISLSRLSLSLSVSLSAAFTPSDADRQPYCL